MVDILSKNIELSILIASAIIGLVVFLLTKNTYVKEKITGWWYIIGLFIVSFVVPYGVYVLIASIVILGVYDWSKMHTKSLLPNITTTIIFLGLLGGYASYIWHDLSGYFYIFVGVGLSDIVAYTVGKNIPFMKGFTKWSPNKTLSGVIGQIVFLAIFLYFILDISPIIAIIVGILAPFGDILESVFKRLADIKDSGNYIPGHGGVLDRIDSSLLGINVLFVLMFI